MISSFFTIIFLGIFAIAISVLTYLFLYIKPKTPAVQTQAIDNKSIFKSVFYSSPIGTGLLSLNNHWLEVNESFCHLLGYSEAELLSLDYSSIIHPDDLLEDLSFVDQLNENKIPYFQHERRLLRKDKQVTWVLLTKSLVRNDNGTPLYYIIQVQDVNDKRKTVNELSYKAYYDALTGLFNRGQLENSIELSIYSALHHQNKFAVFFIDLDHFKDINDRLGHDTGDELLKMVGENLKNNIRQSDIAARLGGDEFILVLNGINNAETAAIFAEKIINLLIRPIKVKEHELFITVSIGISFYPSDGSDFTSLLKSADLALYKAKENGRNNYQFCTPEMNIEIKEKSKIKKALQSALDNHEFHLVYLPKLDVKKKIISGFEVLLRWKNEKYGDVSPNKIIPLADEMGIMNELSEWIIQTSLEQTKQWSQYGLTIMPKIAINVSAKHYTDSDFIDRLLKILSRTQLPPNYLQLEINENLIMRDPDYSLKIIRELKRSGIQIVIDNFGTGYSSLHYLHQFGVDYIKIDRHFTQSTDLDDQRVLFLVAITDLAKNLNIKTLAEGIESKEQMDLMIKIGCDEIQGFFISPPLLANQIFHFLKNYAKTLELPIIKE